ncbi:DUF6538 domain-containing protein [Terasakiella pusilla]|uniref:DUF6538 domain-containing protein n=1 Tax=Terasakiella pusilla TaxID=64973 RepID=UPI003AA951ED
MRRDGSKNHYFRQRIPLDVLDVARGKTITLPLGDATITKTISPKATEIKVSLKTSDPSEAKALQGVLAAKCEIIWQSFRKGTISLTQKQTNALAGEVYEAWVNALEEDPSSPEAWERVLEENKDVRKGEYREGKHYILPKKEKILKCLELRVGKMVDVILANHSLMVDEASRVRLLMETLDAMDEAAKRLKLFAEGDYSPNDLGKRFPKWEASKPQKAPKNSKPQVDMMKLVEDWWVESERAGLSFSTYDGYKRTFKNLCSFLGHRDAARVAPEDVVAFKDDRLQRINKKTGKPISPKTVKDQDLAGLKSVFGWALNNRYMKSNPASDVTVKVGKTQKVRERYFTDEECKAILTHAKNYQPTGAEKQQFIDAKRWVPWICAYTGARIGEILQLRKRDFKEIDGYWTYRITPEAGNVKTHEYRVVPIHQHLIDMGLLDFVSQAKTDYLFILAENAEQARKQVRTRRTKMGQFIREAFPDRNLQPNHGWRHTFRTLAREIDNYDPKVLDDITGHSSRTEGDRYGESRVKAKAQLMNKYPRYPS